LEYKKKKDKIEIESQNTFLDHPIPFPINVSTVQRGTGKSNTLGVYNMTYHLQMTYLPHAEKPGNFFIWITDNQDNPFHFSEVELKEILSKSEWSSFFHLTNATSNSITIEHIEEEITFEGLLVPMWSMFNLLQKDLFNPPSNDQVLIFSTSFFYWQKIAKCLSVLLENGHYYPTLLELEKDDAHYFFAHWMLGRRLINSLINNDWIKTIPQPVLSPVKLAPLPIRRWLDVVLDTWVDQLIRHFLEPNLSSLVKKIMDGNRLEAATNKWVTHLLQKENHYFQANSDFLYGKQDCSLSELQELGKQIEKWHQFFVSEHEPNPRQSLILLKEIPLQTLFIPQKLFLEFAPIMEQEEDPGDIFEESVYWQLSLSIEGNIEGEKQTYPAEDVWLRHPNCHPWIQEKIQRLLSFSSEFSDLKSQQHQGNFTLFWSGDNVASFYHGYKKEVNSYQIHIQLSPWIEWKNWSEQEVEITLETTNASKGKMGSSFGLSSLVQFNWRISIGEVSFSIQEFKAMLKEEKPFLHYKGEWIELPLEQMWNAYQELNEVNGAVGSKGHMSDLLQLSLLQQRSQRKHLHLQVHEEAKEYLHKLLERPKKGWNIPSTFVGKLRPYQEEGFSWLCSLNDNGIGGCLADDMGLGKTIQAIVYLLEKGKQGLDNPPLIICPTSLIGNWKREINLFAPTLKVYDHHGPTRLSREQFIQERKNIDVMVTSYAIIGKDASWMKDQIWPCLILDEAQAIKNPGTKQSQIIRRLESPNRIALTGTPMENKLEELWSIMDFLNPGYLGSLRRFRQQFITPIEKHDEKTKAEILKKLIHPFILRRRKTDTTVISDLPEKIEKKEFCYLSKEQASIYQSIVDELMNKMNTASGIERKGLILSALTKLKQACDHPYLVTKQRTDISHSGKLTRFFEIVDPLLDQNQSALIFTQYVEMGKLLEKLISQKYKDCPVFFLYGNLTSTKREEMIQQFKRYKEQKAIFILSLKAGGVGLNLTEANHVIHYDRWWNPAVEDQATDRAYRIGQQNNVYVYKLISEGTLEEGIDQLIDRKRGLTDQIIEGGDGWVTELSDDALFELIRLRDTVITG
jgi:SNF2 family DNA or RNA helicase